MGYTALYRKFRPMTFSEMVGQEHITKTLKNQIMADRVGHAYIFNGGRGTGKTSAAKVMARAINCLNIKDGEPCNECEICKSAISGALTDIVEMDAASNNSVEDVRSIREAVNFLPTKAKYRVYIIDEVHMLSIGAFNALLKTLEEPPEHAKFILATTEPQKIPVTILSRCQRFDFKRISPNDIKKRLRIVCKESDIEITEEALNIIAVLAEGGMRDALSILERCVQDGENKIDENKVKDLVGIPKIIFIKRIIESIIDYQVENALLNVQEVLDDGKDINNLVWEMIKYLKDILLFKATNKIDIYSEEEINDIKIISEKVSKERLMFLICNLSELENSIKMSTQKLIIFQTGIIRLCNKIEENNSKIESDGDNQNSQLLNRIIKIENYLREKSFSKSENNTVKKVQNTSSINIPKMEKQDMKQINYKYSGKTQEYWPQIINNLKKDGKMMLYINLNGTVAKEINDMTIGIEFPNGMNQINKQVLEMPENMATIKNMVSIASGKEKQIKYINNIQEKNNEDLNAGIESFANNYDLPFNVIE